MDFLSVNLGQKVTNSSTLYAPPQLPPQIQKSNNTPLNINRKNAQRVK
jgi:hypothetical protein